MATINALDLLALEGITTKWEIWAKNQIATNGTGKAIIGDVDIPKAAILRDLAEIRSLDTARAKAVADNLIVMMQNMKPDPKLKKSAKTQEKTMKKRTSAEIAALDEVLKLKSNTVNSAIQRLLFPTRSKERAILKMNETSMLTQYNKETKKYKKVAMSGLEEFKLEGVRIGKKENVIIVLGGVETGNFQYECSVKDAVNLLNDFWAEITPHAYRALAPHEREDEKYEFLGRFDTELVPVEKSYESNPNYGAW